MEILKKRKDGKLNNVIINEDRNKNETQYLVKKLPFQFKNREQFNFLNN
jgi:U3 small nucleolar RNA-associated protein 14